MKKILVVGIFLSEKNKHLIYRTAADQLAELLDKNGYATIKVSEHLGKIKRFIDTLFTIISKIFQYNIAIVPLYGGTASLLWADSASFLLKLLNKKVILIIHGGSIPQRMKINPGNYLRVIRRCDVVACPSNFIIQSLKKYNVDAVLIENVLNLKEYHFHSKEKFKPTLFWMRTFENAYNPLMAVRVLHHLKKKYPDAKMIMAGRDQGLLQQTIDLAKTLNVFDSITFPGYVDIEMKNKIAEEFDIHICTNKIDNAPVSMIEMMSLGLAIVTTNAGGIPFLVENKVNGLLVNIDDDKAMAEQIEFIIENENTGRQLVSSGLLFSKKFDEEPVMQKWKEVFNQLAK
jgi:glycosyltransferase involved in cell wall biosynthesis